MKNRPTRTTNRLHFDDLEPRRFEDLCLALIYPMLPWDTIRHYGRLGGDGGVDIYALERQEDGTTREWFVQCRRLSKATAKDLKKAVDDSLSKAEKLPAVLLVVLACDVTRKAHETYVAYAASKGIGTPHLWTQSVLEAKLYGERKDLLFSYFGISMASESRRRESTIRRNIGLKKRMMRDFLKGGVPSEVRRKEPYKAFNCDKVIIRSVDDEGYPHSNDSVGGVFQWYSVEPYDFYFDGMEMVIGIERVIVDDHGKWALLDSRFNSKDFEGKELRAFKIGCLPYRDIVEYDMMGDEYYNKPHVYCRFAEGGSPFEEIRYRLILENRAPPLLQPQNRLGEPKQRPGIPPDRTTK